MTFARSVLLRHRPRNLALCWTTLTLNLLFLCCFLANGTYAAEAGTTQRTVEFTPNTPGGPLALVTATTRINPVPTSLVAGSKLVVVFPAGFSQQISGSPPVTHSVTYNGAVRSYQHKH